MRVRKINGSGSQRAISLIEVMVVVAITAILAMMSAQFGIMWSNNAKVTQSQATLQQAFAHTKATALQNYAGQTNGAPAAVLCFSGTQLTVYQGGACSGTTVWTRSMATGVTVAFGAPASVKVAANCVALSNAGVPQSSAGSLACTTSLNYILASGGANVSNKTLY